MASRKLEDKQRRELLEEMSRFNPDADSSSNLLELFLPLPVHSEALGTRTLIVRGERGAGKTALFKLLRTLKRKQLPTSQFFDGLDDSESTWVEGFSEEGMDHPSTSTLLVFAERHNDETLRWYWLGHLVGRIAMSCNSLPSLPSEFHSVWNDATTDPERWVSRVHDTMSKLSRWLDEVERQQSSENETLFVTYDHLDRIADTNPAIRRRYASSLMHLWLSLSNRYRFIRPKIFLREDLFAFSLKGAADASKLESRSVSLTWNTESLYRMLLMRFLASPRLEGWLRKRFLKSTLRTRNPFGVIPPEMPEKGRISQQKFAEQLAGKVMGSGTNKGFVHRWMINHLQDAHGQVVPRSLINLLRFAAQSALRQGPKATYYKLLHPQELQRALEETSKMRISELAEEQKVVGRLDHLTGKTLFLDRNEIISLLSQPSTMEDGFGTDGLAVYDELIRIGVLKERSKNRVDIPDIYRYGKGIKRRGGVKRPA